MDAAARLRVGGRPWAWALALVATGAACGEDRPGGAPRSPRGPVPPVVAEPPASPAEKAAYALARVLGGPERTAGVEWIPHFHQAVLTDAVQGLVALPEESVALLSDERLRERVTTQEDTNPWHGILDAWAHLAPRAPAVARAWARPAISHGVTGLRRRAVAVYARLSDPADAPVLVEALRRDAGDPVVASGAASALLGLGPDAAREAARAAYEQGGPELWIAFPALVEQAWGDASADLLRWWVALTSASGPRAHVVLRPDGTRRPASDPAAGPVVGPEHLAGDGTASAQVARAILARRTGEAAGSAGAADAEAAVARLRAALDRAEADTSSPAVREAAEAVAGVSGAPSDDVVPLLQRAVRRLRPAEAWRPAIEGAFDGLRARGAPTGPLLEALLGGSNEDAALGALLLRRERNPDHVPIVERALAAASGRARHELRALLIWLHTGALGKGGVGFERLAAFVRTVVAWVAEGAEGAGFASTLLDLGPPGLDAFARGLRGPEREAYLRALEGGEVRLVPQAVVAAVLAPVDASTPAPLRRLALAAAFRTAGPDAEPALVDLANRVDVAARDEVLLVARAVRHRARPAPR